jgi:hypothetical protein
MHFLSVHETPSFTAKRPTIIRPPGAVFLI